MGTVRGIGTQFIGESDPCGRCRSYARTVFVSFVVPLIPLASYRVREIGFASGREGRAIDTRRIPLVTSHVLIALATAAGGVALGAALFLLRASLG